MNSRLMRLAVDCVREWTWLYTWGMSPASRETRRAEIESDLWEFQCDAAGDHVFVSASHILLRLVIGIPDDLGWRVEQEALAGRLAQESMALCARVAGAALFVCALWVIDADISQRRQVMFPLRAVLFNPELDEIMARRTDDVPYSPGRKIPLLTAGIVAIVGESMMPTLTAQWARSFTHATPAFEAASIRPNKSGSSILGIAPQPGGRFMATNVTVGLLIRNAYQLPRFRVSEGPDWIESDRFDVVATAGYDAPQSQLRLMVQTLLAERFKLKVHTQTREQPVYELVMARRDGRLGPNLRRTEHDCTGEDWPNLLPASITTRCGLIGAASDVEIRSGRSRFALLGTSMEGFARFLQGPVRRYVFDRTGLDGYFNGEFDFTVEIDPPPPPPGLPDPYDRTNFQTIFTVLPEQLGLKLEPTTGPVDVLVIDSVERPTPD
jgi:uncharacterized protein (TIGR03435 family)